MARQWTSFQIKSLRRDWGRTPLFHHTSFQTMCPSWYKIQGQLCVLPDIKYKTTRARDEGGGIGTAEVLPFPNCPCIYSPGSSIADICASTERQASHCLFRAQEWCCRRPQTGTKVGTVSLLFYSGQIHRKKICCSHGANTVKSCNSKMHSTVLANIPKVLYRKKELISNT